MLYVDIVRSFSSSIKLRHQLSSRSEWKITVEAQKKQRYLDKYHDQQRKRGMHFIVDTINALRLECVVFRALGHVVGTEHVSYRAQAKEVREDFVRIL